MSMRRLLVVQQEVAENTYHEDAGFTESHGTNEINNARSTSRLAEAGRSADARMPPRVSVISVPP
jgi:hypothetical protein